TSLIDGDENLNSVPSETSDRDSTVSDVSMSEPVEPEEEIEGKDGQTSGDLSEKAYELASIAGYVTDTDGYAIENAAVRVEVARDGLGQDVFKVLDARTGADGRYRITGIPSGEGLEKGTGMYVSAPGYDSKIVWTVPLLPGANREDVNFTLGKERFFIAGRVISEERGPVSGASVNLWHLGYNKGSIGSITSTDKWTFAITDEEGHFRVSVRAAGLCDFTVTKEGQPTGLFQGIQTGSDDVEFVLRPGGAIAGKVTRADGTVVPGAVIEVVGQAFPGAVAVWHTGLSPHPIKPPAFSIRPVVATTDDDGDYIVEGLGEDYFYRVMLKDVPGGKSFRLPRFDEAKDFAAFLEVKMARRYGMPGAPQRTGIRIDSGQTTTGVDFVVDAPLFAIISGKATDPETGSPSYPLIVWVNLNDPEGKIQAVLGGTTITNEDGSYSLKINLAERHGFHISYSYCEGGGTAINPITTLELAPGAEEVVDFTARAPLTVPVRFVDGDGLPLQDVVPGMRQLDGSRTRAWGTVRSCDQEGRVVWVGLEPERTLQATGYVSDQTVGMSEPFTGKPGETVPEITIVYAPKGGIEGVVVDSTGNPVARKRFGIVAVDNEGVERQASLKTDNDGRFVVLQAFPVGQYVEIKLVEQRGDVLWGRIQDVEISLDSITDVGTVVVEAATVGL
ncbi:carboxypeptidase-like regulatory domain-containing protein, partial [Candidatus Hydrogenedentota bacterium]